MEFEITDQPWIDPWLPHDHPERPFDEGTWWCGCQSCRWAVRAEAHHSPFTPLCLRTGQDRIIVSAEYLSEHLVGGGALSDLLYVQDDWINEVFVPLGSWRWTTARTRWWSLMLHEDEDIAGIGHVRHQFARHEGAATIDLRQRYFVAESNRLRGR